jgi:hypothetical protein
MISNFMVGSALVLTFMSSVAYAAKDIMDGSWWSVIGVLASVVWGVCAVEFIRFYEIKRK